MINTEIERKKDRQINELKEENKLLFEQLSLVQEELEKCYNILKNSNNNIANINNVVIIPSVARNALIENIKLHALVKIQKAALQVEHTNSLAVRLGEMLIKGVASTGKLIVLPVKLCKMWKALNQTIPPQDLGGKNFQKVLDAYTSGGSEAVEKLLNSVFLSPVMRANAYTALAREVMLVDIKQAATFARLAWETDPRIYRLKWLAFRVHEAGDAITADAILDLLPEDITLNQSEKKHIDRIHKESKYERIQDINKILESSFDEKHLLETISNLKKLVLESKNKEQILTNQLNQHNINIKKINSETYLQLNKLQEKHKQELTNLNKQITDFELIIEQYKKRQEKLQNFANKYKDEFDSLSCYTALLIKNIINEFESDSVTISKIVKIILNKEKELKK